MKCNIQAPCLKPTSFAVDVQLMSKTHGGWVGAWAGRGMRNRDVEEVGR